MGRATLQLRWVRPHLRPLRNQDGYGDFSRPILRSGLPAGDRKGHLNISDQKFRTVPLSGIRYLVY